MSRFYYFRQHKKAYRYLQVRSLLFYSAVYLLMLNQCDLPTSPGPQPRSMIDVKFEPGLNIFGVLRADSISGSSFIHVERAATTAELYAAENIFDTTAMVLLTDVLTGNTYRFATIDDSQHIGYYYNADFQAIAGRRYTLSVQSTDLPVLTGATSVPIQPQIVDNSLRREGNELRFDLHLNADTYQYLCYLISDANYLEQQFLNKGGIQTSVVFDLRQLASSPTAIVIIAYDYNLTQYSNSTPSFIPQTYHEMINTVENGYGCFGSLAVTTIKL